jgi:hypothetical protein
MVFTGYSVSSINKIDNHDITEILLKVALNTINQTKPKILFQCIFTCFILMCLVMPEILTQMALNNVLHDF